ncbi:glycoside hydrolase family 3 [Colletotrichum plurivorum]|uniref:Glycoside hydrolase family 3 n=1 Tax=Colletotrichum plurivorum TaxID=2175906 RepID=A0A8H6JNR7_9PEZI|nr:glycoside hydrolase family 3 [Colletotrichum plurivorum]
MAVSRSPRLLKLSPPWLRRNTSPAQDGEDAHFEWGKWQWEDVGFAFNKNVITSLLKNELLRLPSPLRQPYVSNYAAAMIRNGTLEFNAMERESALLGSYGSGPEAFLDVVCGVDGSFEDVRFDTEVPLFTFGHD